jgi:TPR repeat protein
MINSRHRLYNASEISLFGVAKRDFWVAEAEPTTRSLMKNISNRLSACLLPIILIALAVSCACSLEGLEGALPLATAAGQMAKQRACGDIPYSVDQAKTGATSGNAMYMSLLSERYACGAGVAENPAEAFRWALAAANKNYAPAMFIVGGLYESGVGVAKNTQNAGEWYHRAAEAGEPAAFSRYRYLFEHGSYRPVSAKEGEALQLYKKAADAFAVHRYDISLPDLKRASELGLSWATVDVGTHYEFGDGVQKDTHTALEWYWAAAKSGNKQGAKRWDTLSAQLQAQASAPKPGCPTPPMMYPGVAHDRNGRETPVSTLTSGFCHQFPRCTYFVPGIGQIQCP